MGDNNALGIKEIFIMTIGPYQYILKVCLYT